jgi:RNA polymerase sigma factor (sigma-70 family)
MSGMRRDEQFSQFFAARGPALRRTAYLIVRDWHAAEDVTQLGFARLYVVWPRIRQETLEPYARRIMVNEALGWIRRHRRESVAEAVPDTSAPAAADSPLDVGQALDLLPAQQRAIVALRFLDDLPVAEVRPCAGDRRGHRQEPDLARTHHAACPHPRARPDRGELMTPAPDHGGDLATLVRDHVRHDEPPFAMSADTVIALGRRTLLRRRARRGFAGVVVAAAAVAALPLMPWHGSDSRGGSGIDPATTAALAPYDARKMPQLIDEHVRAALGASLDGLGDAGFRAGDSQGVKLPPEYYDKASGMSVSYGARMDPRQVVVSLLHSGSEAEGDVRKICASEVAAGYSFSCTVSTSPDGDPVVVRVMAMRDLGKDYRDVGWGALTREELRTGVPVKGDPSDEPIDPAKVYFQRSVESVHSDTFLTTAQEIVKAPDLATAEQLWKVPVGALQNIVTDPVLVMPKPPIGDNGCGWMLHPEGMSCGK